MAYLAGFGGETVAITYYHSHGNGYCRNYVSDQLGGRGKPITCEVAYQFEAIGTAALRFYGLVNGGHDHFEGLGHCPQF